MAAFEAFGDDVSVSTVESGPVRTRVAQIGHGPDIVWVPGGDSPAEAWVHQMHHFAGLGYRCTSYDPRGVGDAVSPPAPWTIADFAADLAGIIERVCAPPAAVAGLSMGALITQQIAIDRPDCVALGIPMGTAAYIDGFTRDWMQAEIDLRKDGVALPDYFLAPHYAAYALPARALGDAGTWAAIKDAYTARFADRKPQDLIDQWEACLAFDCRAGLAACPVPIHAIAFSEDVQTPPQMVKAVADLARHGHYHEIEGLGHVSVARGEQDVVNALIERILAAEGYGDAAGRSIQV